MRNHVSNFLKRFVAGLLCALITASLMPGLPGGVVQAAEADFPDGTITYGLYNGSGFSLGDQGTWVAITNSSTVNSTDTLKYVIKVEPKNAMDNDGVSYKAKLPNGIVYTGSPKSDEIIKTSVSGGELFEYGRYSISPGDDYISIKFGIPTSELSKTDDHTLGDIIGIMSLDCSIDNDQDDSGHPGKVEIKIPGTTSILVGVDDWTPTDPSDPDVKKTAPTGTLSGDDLVEWTITYTPYKDGTHGGKKYSDEKPDLPSYILDTLPTGMEYVSMTPDLGATVVSPDKIKIPVNTLTEETTITYKTRVTGLSTDAKIEWWKSATTKPFKNEVKLIDANDDPVTEIGDPNTEIKADHTINLNPPAKPSAKKTQVSTSKSGSDVYINWNVELDPKGISSFNPGDLVIEDTMGSGLVAPTDVSDVEVTLKSGSTSVTLNNAIDSTAQKAISGSGFIIKNIETQVNDIVAADSGAKITLTYKTKVSEAYFKYQKKPSDLKNGVKLDWKATNSTNTITVTDTSNSFVTPEETGDLKRPSLIDKAAKGYNHKTGEFKWEITVGTSGMEFDEIHLSDTVNMSKADGYSEDIVLHRFINPRDTKTRTEVEGIIKAAVYDGLKDIDAYAETKYTVDIEIKHDDKDGSGDYLKENGVAPILTIDITPKSPITKIPGGFKFAVSTYNTHYQRFAANNGSGDAKNKVSVLDTTTIDGESVTVDPKEVTQNFDGRFLDKFVDAYDAETGIIRWRVELNKRGVDIGTIKILETLPTGLSYIKGSAKIDGATITNDVSDTTNVPNDLPAVITPGVYKDTNPKSIWFVVGGLDGSRVRTPWNLTFETQVDKTNNIFKNNAVIEFKNNVKSWTSDPEHPGLWTPSQTAGGDATVKIPGNTVDKKGVQETKDKTQKVTYTVNINPYGRKLLNIDGVLTLEDTLPKGLEVDVKSVKLFSAKVKKYTSTGNNLDLSNQSVLEKDTDISDPTKIGYNPEIRKLSVEIKDETPYILEYVAYFTQSSTAGLQNAIELVGSLKSGESTTHSISTMKFDIDHISMLKLPPELLDSYVQVAVHKLKEDGTSPLSGVTFGLYKDEAATQEVAEGTTDAYGNTTLTAHIGLLGGTKPSTVYLKEKSTTLGYKLLNTIIPVSVAVYGDGSVELNVKNELAATPLNGKIKIRKISSAAPNPVLPGAGFAVFADSSCTILVGSGITNGSGELEIGGLNAGETYYVKETAAPTGFNLNATPVPVVAVDSPGESDIKTIQNTPTTAPLNGKIKIRKVSSVAPNPTLPGAAFDIFEDSACTVRVGYGATNGSGELEIGGLKAGDTYYIKETTAPTGFNLNATIVPVVAVVSPSDSDIKTIQNTPAGGGGGGPLGGGYPPGGGGKDPDPKPDPKPEPKPEPEPDPGVAPVPDPIVPEGAIKVEFVTPIGPNPDPQIKQPGNVADEPGTPINPSDLVPGVVIDGYRFDGWYIDKELTIPYDFSNILASDITLYAKWTKVGGMRSPRTGGGDIPRSLLPIAAGLLGYGLSPLFLKKRRSQ